MSEIELMPLLLQVFAPGGVLAIAAKLILNGSKRKIDEIHGDVKEIKEKIHELDKRVTVLEVL